jgi:E3 ubiquitin-protein ligase UBR4
MVRISLFSLGKHCDVCLFLDVNVEHLQLLIFLLHGLPLMVKKTLLLRIAQCVLTVAQTKPEGSYKDSCPLPITRLLVVMDYLLHFFYDPPSQLIEQVK